jgi:small subunit ribosomal protein S6
VNGATASLEVGLERRLLFHRCFVFARLCKLRLQLVGGRELGGVVVAMASAPERSDAESAEQKRQEPSHEADATLPPLLATPVAPLLPEAAPRRRGRHRDHGKEQFGNVNEYEILLMLDPELPEERGNEVIARMRESVEGDGGSWDGHEPWGRRKLAYEIDHKGEGVYHLLLFTAPPETLAEITRVLKITDGVIRHLAVNRVKGGQTKAPPAVPAAPVAAVSAPADDAAGTAE